MKNNYIGSRKVKMEIPTNFRMERSVKRERKSIHNTNKFIGFDGNFAFENLGIAGVLFDYYPYRWYNSIVFFLLPFHVYTYILNFELWTMLIAIMLCLFSFVETNVHKPLCNKLKLVSNPKHNATSGALICVTWDAAMQSNRHFV